MRCWHLQKSLHASHQLPGICLGAAVMQFQLFYDELKLPFCPTLYEGVDPKHLEGPGKTNSEIRFPVFVKNLCRGECDKFLSEHFTSEHLTVSGCFKVTHFRPNSEKAQKHLVNLSFFFIMSDLILLTIWGHTCTLHIFPRLEIT